MAGPQEVGRLYVGLDGKDVGLGKALKKAEGQANKAAGGISGIAAAATKAQAAVSKILIPVALISSIMGAIALVKRLGEAAGEADREFKTLADSQAERLRLLLREQQSLSDAEKRRAEHQDNISKSMRQQTEIAEKQNNWLNKLKTQMADEGWFFADKFFETTDEMTARLKAQNQELDNINAALGDVIEKDIERLDLADKQAMLLKQQEESAERFKAALQAQIDLHKEDARIFAEMAEAERKRERERMEALAEFEAALRNSAAGGFFGGGAVAGGDLGAVARELGVIADRMGRAP